jgi:predicted aminopeptidase
MVSGFKVLETAVTSTRRIAEYTEKVEALRRAEHEAERKGDFRAALAAYTERVATIMAGPSAS